MGFFSSKPKASSYRNRRSGRQVSCTHCGGWEFERREAMLNTSLLTAADLDFLNHSACALICTSCGHIEWFLEENDLETLD